VKEEPAHIDQVELAHILLRQWGLATAALRYLPVGFGDHHWEATDAAGGRWFVTVAALAGGWRGAGREAGYADLRAAMETVIALRRAGLEFAVAPVPTAGGEAIVRAAARSGPVVITHGEPHPGNILRSAGTMRLIDWDTVGLALPERDLWMVAGDDSCAADRYAGLTGRPVSGAALRMYKMRWSLDDIALAIRDFRAPHEQNEDSALTWDTLTETIGEIA
jgi:hypothetical protein